MAFDRSGSLVELEPPKLVCSRPFMALGRMPVPCRQCKACRIASKLRVVLRAELERRCHADACCATLTYSDEFLGNGQVRKAEWKKVKERLYCMVRKDLGVKLRFFGIGEYGEHFGRPHWHVVAFGLPLALGQAYWEKAWTDPVTGKLMGNVQVGEAGYEALRYIAGYCVKKLTRPDDPWLDGRAPEFVIRPNRPGLGLGFVDDLAQSILSNPAALDEVKRVGDVPAEMRLGRGRQALDKLFKQKLRVSVLGEEYAELAREARGANYLAECAVGGERFGRFWSLGGPATDTVRVRQRVTRAKIFASARSL